MRYAYFVACMIPKISYKKHPIPFHVVFWIGYFLVGLSIFVGAYSWEEAALRVGLGMIFHMFLVYVNVYWVFPRFFLDGRYVLHYMVLAVLVLVVSWIRVEVDIVLDMEPSLAGMEYGSMQHFGTKVLAAAVVLSFSTSFRYLEDYVERTQLQQELKNYKLEAELKFLKAQVNPHFLFNSLNNLYSMAVTNTSGTAPMILKLSEMMRYMLYESNEERVQLVKEIDYLSNYIALQQLKTEQPQRISLKVSGPIERVKIVPMLLIPFWENGIKHGDVDYNPEGWIQGVIEVTDKVLRFDLKNTIDMHKAKDKVGGIGLDNVQKRLKLLYKSKHKLEIGKQDNIYAVHLEIDLT